MECPSLALPPLVPDARESGIALFVVMVVVMVLTVVISQLSITTKVEEQIAKARQGHLEVTYSFRAVARSVLLDIYDDWVADLEQEAGGEPQGGETAQPPGPAGGAGPGGGSGDESAAPQSPVDSRHEEWRRLSEETINQVLVVKEVIDLESCIALSNLFWYVTVEEDEQNPDESSDPTADGGSTGGTPPAATPTETDPDPGDEIPEEEEFEFPSEERIEKTRLMLARLIEGVIDYNQDHGFEYLNTPSPDSLAETICDWALNRMAEEQTRVFWTFESVRHLDGVTTELMDGPRDPASEDYDEEGYPQDEAGFQDPGRVLSSLGINPELYESSGSVPGYEDVEDGIEQIPRPLGLRHVMCAFSSGKINLNTARPEVLAALLIDVEDFDQALEVALEVDLHLNTYADAGDEEDSGSTTSTDEDDENREFNVLTVMDDLREINEDWLESGSGDEKSIWEYMQQDWQPVAVFQSKFFHARLRGTHQDRELEAELDIVRDTKSVRVLQWRDLSR